jgi:hypothetical protein
VLEQTVALDALDALDAVYGQLTDTVAADVDDVTYWTAWPASRCRPAGTT